MFISIPEDGQEKLDGKLLTQVVRLYAQVALTQEIIQYMKFTANYKVELLLSNAKTLMEMAGMVAS